jgi:ABC-type Zn uptake system ZnuABC Zn-binding protein ZnuA
MQEVEGSMKIKPALSFLLVMAWILSACQPAAAPAPGMKIMAVESFLADMAQQVAGNRLQVETLIPLGVDPHSFEVTPKDVAAISQTDVLIVNGFGLESWLQETIQNSGSKAVVVEAAKGLTPRNPTSLEILDPDHTEGDPHFWLDPMMAVAYVENIRDGLIQADPAGKDEYTVNAATYIRQLQDLDGWVKDQVSQIPADRRLLVTNHESFGYYADRYGFKVVGAIIPSVTSDATPTAQELSRLIDQIKTTGAPAIFLETGTNPQLADQIASETGVKVIQDLYTHSISTKDGQAPTYIDMIKWNTNQIVDALK